MFLTAERCVEPTRRPDAVPSAADQQTPTSCCECDAERLDIGQQTHHAITPCEIHF